MCATDFSLIYGLVNGRVWSGGLVQMDACEGISKNCPGPARGRGFIQGSAGQRQGMEASFSEAALCIPPLPLPSLASCPPPTGKGSILPGFFFSNPTFLVEMIKFWWAARPVVNQLYTEDRGLWDTLCINSCPSLV